MALGLAAAVRVVKHLVPALTMQHMIAPDSGLLTPEGAVVLAGNWPLETELSWLA